MDQSPSFALWIKSVGLAAAAKILNETPQAVSNWRGRGIPPNKTMAVSILSGISVRLLRPSDWPDYWPDAPEPTEDAGSLTPPEPAKAA